MVVFSFPGLPAQRPSLKESTQTQQWESRSPGLTVRHDLAWGHQWSLRLAGAHG